MSLLPDDLNEDGEDIYSGTAFLEDHRVPAFGLTPHRTQSSWEQPLSSPYIMSSDGNHKGMDTGHHQSTELSNYYSNYDSGVEVSYTSTASSTTESSGYGRSLSGLQSINESGVSDNYSSSLADRFDNLTVSSSGCLDSTQSSRSERTDSIDENYLSSEGRFDSTADPENKWTIAYQQDDEGDTYLHIAIIQKDEYHAHCLIDLAPTYIAMDLQNTLLQSPLHLTILTKLTSGDLVRKLLAAGATPDLRDRNGNTALHLACKAGDFKAVCDLTTPLSDDEVTSVTYDLPPSHRFCIPQDLNLRNYEGDTCLHLAAANSHYEIINHLIKFGADINIQEAKCGRTILHQAVEKNHIQLAAFILSLGKVELQTQDYARRTALELVAGLPLTDPMVDLLIKQGACPDDLDVFESEEEYMSDPQYDDFAIEGEPI